MASRSPLAPRGASTWRIYASNGLSAFSVNGLGAIQIPLRAQLGISYEEAAFFATLYALATLVVGVFGGRIARALGTDRLLTASLGSFAVGGVLFWLPSHAVALVGAFLLGLGGGLMILLVPMALMRLHGAHTALAIAETSSLATFSGMAAPLVVGGVLALGFGWQFGYLLPVLVAAAVLLVLTRRPLPDAARAAPAPLTATRRTGAAAVPLASIILAVSTEFALVFGAASAVEEHFTLPTALAVATTGVFVAGVAVGRLAGRPMISRMQPFWAVVAAALGTHTGFAIFFTAPNYPIALVGLAVSGLSLSILYPILMTRLLAAFPDRPERASQLGVLANGISVGLSPLLLAVIAGAAGMRIAMLWVPTLLVVLILLQVAHHLGDRTATPTSTPDVAPEDQPADR